MLGRVQAHVDRWFSGWSTLGLAWKDIVSAAFNEQKYPPSKWLPDALTLSLNALDLVMCGIASDPGTTTIVPRTVVDSTGPSDITFDVMSEMAGPMVFTPGPATLSVVAVSPLVQTSPAAAGSTIPAANVLVRVLGEKVMVTLVGLKEISIPPGTYQGTLQLQDPESGVVSVQITAICRDTLFWSP